MKLKLWLLLIIFFILPACVESRGQTSADLEHKYGPPAKYYKIKPDLMMTAKYDEDGQVCVMYVERRRVSETGFDLRLRLSKEEVSQLIEELVPAEERRVKGKADGLSRITGMLAEQFYDYENVTVVHVSGVSGDGENGGDVLVVKWKQRSCK